MHEFPREGIRKPFSMLLQPLKSFDTVWLIGLNINLRKLAAVLISSKSIMGVILISAVLLGACVPGPAWGGWPMGRSPQQSGRVGSFSSNGEQIYFTATNDRGERIDYLGGPSSDGMMMSTNLACADCHGSDGRGGSFRIHMQVIEAPDIRYQTLTGEFSDPDEDGHMDDDHLDEHGEYSLEYFRRAVVDGQHPDGEPLRMDMPRWQINDEDLADLFEYLKSLP